MKKTIDFWIDFWSIFGRFGGPFSHQNRMKWNTKTMSKKHQKTGDARRREEPRGAASSLDPGPLEYNNTPGPKGQGDKIGLRTLHIVAEGHGGG